MSNSALIAAMGSVAASVFFLAAVLLARIENKTMTDRVMFIAAILFAAIYLFVSLFWGVRATSLESFQVTKRDDEH